MKKVLLASIAAMFLCSGCIELLMLGCDNDTDDCFASTATPPAPLAPAPVDMAR